MYVLLILAACILNWRHKEALLLAMIVGLGAVMPIPKEYGALVWYSICVSIELTIMVFALTLHSKFSIPIASLSILFVAVHILGYLFGGYIIGSPYHYFAKTLEYTELLSCVILSNPIINFVKERI